MESVRKQLAVLIVFIALLGVGVYGVRLPQRPAVMPVATMQLAAYPNGLTLTQGRRNAYYTFSPFNDYFVVKNKRTSFITQEDIKDNPLTTSLNGNKMRKTIDTVRGYFAHVTPIIKFASKRTVTYNSTVVDNKITVNSTVTVEEKPRIISATMTWKVPDVIFDKTGRLYNYVSPKDREFFRESLGVTLNQDELGELRVLVPQNAVVIVNPHVAGALVIRASRTQRLFVDRSWRFVEVQQAAEGEDGTYHAHIEVEVYPTAKEAIKAL